MSDSLYIFFHYIHPDFLFFPDNSCIYPASINCIFIDFITKLANLPQKFHLVDDPVLASWGIRFVIINNYLAFYTIDEEKQTVIIVRFLYQKSNWTSILRQGFSSNNLYIPPSEF